MKLILIFLNVFFILICNAQDSSAICVKKANGYYTENLYRDAEIWLLRSIKIDPSNIATHLQLGKLYVEKLQLPVNATTIYNKVLVLNPNNTEAIESLIPLYYKKRNASEVLRILPGLTKPIKYNVNLVKGRCLFWQEDFMGAIDALQLALNKLPNSYEANYFMAQSYKSAGSTVKALPFFEKAIANDTTKGAHLMYELGVMFYNTENYNKAFEYFKMAKNNNIKTTIGFFTAYCYAAVFSGNLKEGKASMDTLIAKRPLDESLVFNAGNVFYNVSQYKEAKEYFGMTLSLNKKNYKALYMAGLCFIKLGDKKKGEEYCDAAIENDPSLANNRQTTGGMKPSFGL